MPSYLSDHEGITAFGTRVGVARFMPRTCVILSLVLALIATTMRRVDDACATKAMIEGAIDGSDVEEWRQLNVSNPKSEPTEAEKAELKKSKEAEKKGKDMIMARIMSRLEGSGVKKDKVKKILEKMTTEKLQEESRPAYLDPPSGTRDFEPAPMRMRNWLFGLMRGVANSFGFKEYDAPVLEHVELYERKAGEEITQQMYSFVDKEGCRVTLRPEMTPSLARLVLNMTNLATGEVRVPLPLKWFSIPQCWRFETTQRGRKREHYQWNMDVVGEASATAEAELLAAACDLFRRVGLTPELVGVRVNSRKIIDGVLKSCAVPSDMFARVCVVVDKLDKIGADAVKEMLVSEPLNLTGDTADKIIACLSANSLDELKDNEGVDEMRYLFELAESYGIRDYLTFDASVVRGLAYYTGIVFEAFDRAGEFRAICGGGRYDKLLELYGGDKCTIPCCGFGFGDCVIVELLKDRGLLPDFSKPSIDFVVAPFSRSEQAPASEVAARLRALGYSVDLALAPRKARAAFDLANRAGARRVAFVAPDEWALGLVRIKDMCLKDPVLQEGIQIDVVLNDLASLEVLIDQKAAALGIPTRNSTLRPPFLPKTTSWKLIPTDKFVVIAPPAPTASRPADT